MEMLAFFGGTLLFLGSTLVVLLLPVAMIRLVRGRRGQYLSAAIAIWAWALWVWAGMAATYPALRDSIGSLTLLALQGVAVFIIVLLVLRISQIAWNWPKGPLWFARLVP
jgi:hypothetical protein